MLRNSAKEHGDLCASGVSSSRQAEGGAIFFLDGCHNTTLEEEGARRR